MAAQFPADYITLADARRLVDLAVDRKVGSLVGDQLLLKNASSRWWPLLQIMLLGDSITAQGAPNNYGQYLFELMRPEVLAARRVPRFVGSANSAITVDGALWVEGHPGFCIHATGSTSGLPNLRANIASYLSAHTPDIVVALAGVNDMVSAPYDGTYNGVTSAVAMRDLVADIKTHTRGRAKVIVCKIPPMDSRHGGFTADKLAHLELYNSQLDAWANAGGSMANEWMVVDCNSGYDSLTMNYDGVHPNEIGARLIGQRIYSGVKASGFGA